MHDPLLPSDIRAGIARIEAIARQLDRATLDRAGQRSHARTAPEQPWLLAGVSDGMGLHTVVAAIEAGLLRVGLGVYWEPPHFLERNAAGEPVSPVHWARVQNAAALQEWARQKGVDFTVVSANVIMAPERDLKGNAKGEPTRFSADVHRDFEAVRARASNKDAVFVNSVAFGKWISPRDGVDPIVVGSVDFEGRIVETKTKRFHARSYEETLDTMGRNHRLLLEAIRGFGWLGKDSLTAFFTWAGGSQNVDVLEGIYGKGALGDAKVIAEADLARIRLEWGLEFGAHAIVRLPAFLSAALMGIPGGGLFGIVSRALLEERGLFEDMPRLAERMLDRMFGPAWIRENPISQIELDTAETLYIEEISARVAEAQDRITRHWRSHPEARESGIDLATSKRLLSGLVAPDYDALLRRFDLTASITVAPQSHGDTVFEIDVEGGELRPDVSIVRALEGMAQVLSRKNPTELALHAEQLHVDVDAWQRNHPLRCHVSWENGADTIVVTRTFVDAGGREVARGVSTLGPRHEHPAAKADPGLLGDAVGPRMPVRVGLHETYDAPEALRTLLQGPALIGFARENLRAAGVFDESVPATWDVRVDGTVHVGDHLLTYARRESGGWVVTVVDDESRPLLQMSLR